MAYPLPSSRDALPVGFKIFVVGVHISKGGIWLFQLILINRSYPSYPKLFRLSEVIQVI